MKSKTKFITIGSLIAALYIVLTCLSNAVGLASGVIQVRLSEMLTILPLYTPAAIPGLFVGCIISNLITGCAPWDIVFGSLATLIGAFGTFAVSGKLLKRNKWTAPLFPIISNTIIVPFILRYVYNCEGALPYFMLTVGIGEIISSGIMGIILAVFIQKNKALNKYLWQ